jgi:hypothetical protein
MAVSSADDDTDQQLRAKWHAMISFIEQGNTKEALKLIHPETRNDYAIMFQAVKYNLPQIISEQIDLKVIRIKNNYAIYELTTNENGKLYSYEVTFSKGEDGKWYILHY